MTKFKTPRERSGLTLIEVSISLLLVSTVLLVSLTASADLMRNDYVSHNADRGRVLGFRLLDEASSMDFRDRQTPIFGAETGETARSTFDDIDDFHGYTVSPPVFRNGNAMADYTGWSVAVSVESAVATSTGISTTGTTLADPLRLVTVTATSPEGQASVVQTLVSEIGSNIDLLTSYQRFRRIQLTFSDGTVVHSTAALPNQPETNN